MNEIWKSVLGFEGLYEVSNHGNVRSLSGEVCSPGAGVYPAYKKCRIGRVLKLSKKPNGYLGVALCKNAKVTYALVHRLVAQEFVENPNKLDQVNHIDSDKSNNSAVNLEWCNGSSNMLHAVANGLPAPRGERNGQAKITELQAQQILSLRKSGWTQTAIGERFGLAQGTVSQIVTGRRWRHLTRAA